MEIPRNAFKRALAEGRWPIGFWLALGTFAPVEDDARRYLDMGVRFAAVGADAVVLRRGADALREAFRGL